MLKTDTGGDSKNDQGHGEENKECLDESNIEEGKFQNLNHLQNEASFI